MFYTGLVTGLLFGTFIGMILMALLSMAGDEGRRGEEDNQEPTEYIVETHLGNEYRVRTWWERKNNANL